MKDFRVEEDLLGPKEVPADAYYGVHTVRAIENFTISSATINDVPEMIRGMVMVKKASALANKELRTIPAEVADAIIAGCDEILGERPLHGPVPGRRLPGWRRDLGQHEHQRGDRQPRARAPGPGEGPL